MALWLLLMPSVPIPAANEWADRMEDTEDDRSVLCVDWRGDVAAEGGLDAGFDVGCEGGREDPVLLPPDDAGTTTGLLPP